METPICDFVRRYAGEQQLRLHMPGHKGTGPLGVEALDITEIDGADSLYEAAGIIRQSEQNAGALFGCKTFYSTEGSSQCIRAMLYLALLQAKQLGRRPLIAAARNVHKTFLSAAALLDLEVVWLYPKEEASYLSCRLEPRELDAFLEKSVEKPTAVYLTSPDYLGNVADVEGIAAVCHRHGVLLIVDGAHGAYLRFLEPSRHPVDLGADLCCASAHKTLPVLTGGAYLHIGPDAPGLFARQAKEALALFGSTSPSYLILQSLDAANGYLEGYPRLLAEFLPRVRELKDRLSAMGWQLLGGEPLKLTLAAKKRGYTGQELAGLLADSGIVCEFADPDFLVLMLTPEVGAEGLAHLETALGAFPRRSRILTPPPGLCRCGAVLTIREAMLSPAERIPAAESAGRILASPSVGCPPAVPIAVCGERISPEAVECFRYYGIESCMVTIE